MIYAVYNFFSKAILYYFFFISFLPQTEAHLDTLISEQASFILARSGVGSLYTVYQENRGQRVRMVITSQSSLFLLML